MSTVQSIGWSPACDALRILDQRELPHACVERDLRTVDEVCDAIRTLAVRGAPAIGAAGAMGLAAAMTPRADEARDAWTARLRDSAARIRAARPTAVNLPWAVDRVLAAVAAADTDGAASAATLAAALRDAADAILVEDRAMCRAIGEHGVALLRDGARVLTHCNAGALATCGIGTALAPVYVAHERGQRVAVWADETRPLLQGSRLTAWELAQAGVPVTVIADGMAAALLRTGTIDAVLVGADRIAANGDAANKIGTYALALAARAHGVPFYVLAPSSTVDVATPDGARIPIEERDPDEVRAPMGRAAAPAGVAVWNPAFDVTPAHLITGIVTESGVVHPPYDFSTLGAPRSALTPSGERAERRAPSAERHGAQS
ncbi:S-methyl-5-thioribose-1-phosphate isomerase [Roseisolibacter agri]|uniref:Methylthioribose-1-phosphate isomerase n=1 Tax=Roseisolibacter agri TaxID=2014610 RepID=A0AA37Q3X9_9BACT|nr:S-methyl-5-thioribose-1-phosphate isomerase [Roseisolibacter agri]GLC26104.1 methylthioribose-1-phosphate isomerase [Roseisolibacter agri]